MAAEPLKGQPGIIEKRLKSALRLEILHPWQTKVTIFTRLTRPSPCWCAICQCWMFTASSPAQARGNWVMSPAAYTFWILVRMFWEYIKGCSALNPFSYGLKKKTPEILPNSENSCCYWLRYYYQYWGLSKRKGKKLFHQFYSILIYTQINVSRSNKPLPLKTSKG